MKHRILLCVVALTFASGAFAKKREAAPNSGCCMTCTAKSQPCGNACIPKKSVCHKPAGCACGSGAPAPAKPAEDPEDPES